MLFIQLFKNLIKFDHLTNETGYIQPTLQQLINARGNDIGGYHVNPKSGWLVKQDGGFYLKCKNSNKNMHGKKGL